MNTTTNQTESRAYRPRLALYHPNARGTGSAVRLEFDWENKIVVKLGFTDLCQMLQVFRGECESIGDGQGLFHRAGCGQTRITLRHLVEPIVGYSLDLYRTLPGGQETSSRFFFSPAEALGLTEAVCGSMAVICFGIPMAQAVSAERAGDAAAKRGKEAVDAAAA